MEIRRGIVRGFDAVNYLASVQLVGSMATYLTSIPVAKHIAAGEMVDGAGCAVLFFDEANPTDAVVLATYGGTGLVQGFALSMEDFIAVQGTPTATTLGASGNDPRVWSLPDGSNTAIGAWVYVPAEWGSGSALRVTVYYTSSVTSGNCDLRLRYILAEDGEDLTTAANTINILAAAPSAANRRKTMSGDISGSDDGDLLRLVVARSGGSGDDTLAGAVLIVGCAVARI